jgi:DNA-binding NtrC family response regulator
MNQLKKRFGLNLSSSEIGKEGNLRHIAIVDEDLSSRVFLKIKFEEAGYTVKDLKSGADAWDYVSSKKVSLLIMEMKLPELHGSELLKKIKKSVPKLAVIIYTSHPEFSGDMTVVTFPNHEYLIKPTPIDKILETAKYLIDKAEQKPPT